MTDDPNRVNQDEIEALLNQGKGGGGEPPSTEEPAASSEDQSLGQAEIEALLNKGDGGSAPAPPGQAASAAEPIEEGDKILAQDEIESLLGQTQRPAPAAPQAAAAAPKVEAAASKQNEPDSGDSIAQQDIELLLRQAEKALASVDAPPEDAPPDVVPFQFEELAGAPPTRDAATIELIRDVELDLRIELGQTYMNLEDVLKLRKGSVVPLDKLAGDPVDVYVNGRLVARGEVLVLNDNFCVRVAELIAGHQASAG